MDAAHDAVVDDGRIAWAAVPLFSDDVVNVEKNSGAASTAIASGPILEPLGYGW